MSQRSNAEVLFGIVLFVIALGLLAVGQGVASIVGRFGLLGGALVLLLAAGFLMTPKRQPAIGRQTKRSQPKEKR